MSEISMDFSAAPLRNGSTIAAFAADMRDRCLFNRVRSMRHGEKDRACHRHRAGTCRLCKTGLTPELIRNHLDAQIGRLRAIGYEAEVCLIDLGDPGHHVVT